jgi:hypothetical protein
VTLNDQSGVTWLKVANEWHLTLFSFWFPWEPSRDLDVFELEHIRTETCARYNYDMTVWLHCTEAYDLRD